MHDLVYALKCLAEQHREGSFATQANRKHMLMLCGTQLVAAGYTRLHATELKGRHIQCLLALWQAQGVAPRTIENRLSVLRWWARHIDKAHVLAKGNAAYGIPTRAHVATASKARDLPLDHLVRVRNAHVRMSLHLQRAFGLRREEALKLKPFQADRGDRLVLQGSWTKGGRPREIPIRTLAQRELLDRAKAFVKRQSASLIPPDKTYAQHLHSYESQCVRAGLHKMHGLRHAYAQDRFLELAGFPCPVMGGPHASELTPEQRLVDAEAREIISSELGHGREAITEAYLGR